MAEKRLLPDERVAEDNRVSRDRDTTNDGFLHPYERVEWLSPTGFSADVHEREPEVGGTVHITFAVDAEKLESVRCHSGRLRPSVGMLTAAIKEGIDVLAASNNICS